MAEQMKVYVGGSLVETKSYSIKKKKTGYAMISLPAAASTVNCVANVNLTNTTLTLAGQPDVPRNVVVKVTDTTASITVGTVTVTGKDMNGNTITEVQTFTGAATKTGSKMFSKITSVVTTGFATLGGAGDEKIECGYGAKLGLPLGTEQQLMEIFKAAFNGGDETVGTVDLDNKSYTPTGTPDNTKDVEVWFTYLDY